MKQKKDELSELVGYQVGKELKKMILKEVRDTGLDIREVVSKFILPEMAILDDSGRFTYDGKKITPQEFFKQNPLKEFAHLVTIKTKENE
jgi:hypothetical protein